MRNFLQLFPELRTWTQTLDLEQAHRLCQSFEKIPFREWQALKIVSQKAFKKKSLPAKRWMQPACFTLEDRRVQSTLWQQAESRGIQHLRHGKVAALTVAGGLGTRLGFPGPKGLVLVTPLKRKTLFQVFAEKLRAIEKLYGVRMHWFIMTSSDTHEATWEAFQKNHWYDTQYLHLFQQGELPAFTMDGICLLTDEPRVNYYPDGHGGVFKALASTGCLDKMSEYGIETLSYFQVDNPLVYVCDCHFLGLHLDRVSDFSTKVVTKTSADEKVGVFVNTEDVLRLLEYSEMPEFLSVKKTKEGQLYFKFGNTAMHLIQRSFLEAMAEEKLPIHITCKTMQHWHPLRQSHCATSCQKLEYFIFDALPFAKNPLLLEVDRKEEFSPVKNTQGQDSLDTCMRDQISRWNRWFVNCGLNVDHGDKEINNAYYLEISPLFADDYISFKKMWNALVTKPGCFENLYLE
ncbi:MAG: UTP--glucose-1-phosphate uridylyltransferase [Puniceicoccales bacterium]|nr:UTP--glucose-1-phosphate uridylyltransferase [Puniceicoccales bacterium]